MGSARAIYFTGPRSVDVRPEELGSPEADQIYVESELIGISHGSERIVYTGAAPTENTGETLSSLSGRLEYPLKYGYMNVGLTSDGRRLFAFFPHQDRFYCRESECLELPSSLDPENAIFLASMETALSIVHDAAPRLGERVMVCGQGVVGLLTAELLLEAGCRTVIAVEPSERRRAISGSLGCTPVAPEDARSCVAELTNGRGVDIAINLSADERALQLCLSSAADEGTVIEASWYGNRSVELSLGTDFHRRRLDIRSSQVSVLRGQLTPRWSKERRFDLVIELLERHKPKRYITHRFPLSDAGAAFELLEDYTDEVLQIVLDPSDRAVQKESR